MALLLRERPVLTGKDAQNFVARKKSVDERLKVIMGSVVAKSEVCCTSENYTKLDKREITEE